MAVENNIRPVNPFEPGIVIALPDITQLPAFEDTVVGVVDPYYNQAFWLSRVNIRDLIRPPLFNGTIADIELTVMDHAYDRLLDARERGWNLGSGKFQSSPYNDPSEHCLGFAFKAVPKSSNASLKGQVIESELWYFPSANKVHKKGEPYVGKNVSKSGDVVTYVAVRKKDYISKSGKVGEAIRRVVARPVFNPEAFKVYQEQSKKVGLEVLRQAMAHPLPGSISQ